MIKKTEQFKLTYVSTTKWILLFNLPLFFLIAVFSKDILRILFGQAYVAGYSSLIILAVGFLFAHSVTTSKEVLIVYKKTKLVSKIILAAAITNVVLNFFLINIFGIIGAAIATSASFFVLGALMLNKSKKISNIFPFKLNNLKIRG